MWIFRWYIFYPLTVLIAVGVVLASFGPALAPEKGPLPTAGVEERGALVFAGEALANPQVSANTVFFVPRDETDWDASGLRIAIRPNSGLVSDRERGVEILLDRTATDWIGTGPLRIEIDTAPLPLSGANQLALGLRSGDRTQWATRNMTSVSEKLTYEFAAASGPVQSLALRPISTDNSGNRGVEIRAIRVSHAPAPAPPPPAPQLAPENATGAPEAPPPS